MLTLFLLMTAGISVQAVKIPDVWELCAPDDLRFNDCLKNSIQTVISNIKHGLPEFNIKQLDPYWLKYIKVDYKNGLFVGRALLESFNVSTHGFSTSNVNAVRMNLKDDMMELEIDMSNKHIFIDGNYRGEILIGVFLLSSDSYFSFRMTDVIWTFKIWGKKKVVDGKIYMNIQKFRMRPEIGKMVVKVPDVYKDNPDLAMLTQNLLQTYWRNIYQEILPAIEKTWNKIGVKVCNKVFKKIPFEELFPLSIKY